MSTQNMARKTGRWVLAAVPVREPVDVRWRCEHEWTPHGYSQGWYAQNYFDCVRCGVNVEAGELPPDGAWPVRSWIARRIWNRGGSR